MRNLYLKVLLFSFTFGATVNAQQNKIDKQNTRDGESVEYCRQHKLTEEALKNDPEFARLYKENKAREEASKGKDPIAPKGVVYRIPTVFHILHNNGSENISDAQVIDALNIMNRDFRLQNADANNVHADFAGLPADSEIEFVLATKAPNGACFSGITRTVTPLTNDGSSGQAQVNAVVQGNDVFQGQWPPNKYMNIYIAKDIGGAAGYTFNPVGGSSMYFNGIFCLQQYCGSIGTSSAYTSRTLTHEVGHWLNLSHTWGGNNNPGNASSCSSDDQVSDTPNTIGVTSCNLNENSCGPRANVENYMDYSYCSKMYTPGQVARMRTALNNGGTGRSNLWQSANITATGADSVLYLCKAAFSASQQTVCVGTVVNFTDRSFNVVNGWNWSFPGGTPATSTSQNPTVTYSTPGTYAVTLTATDGSTQETTTKTDYITVLPAGLPLNYAESFENYTNLTNTFWTATSVENNNKFEVFTGAGAGSGTKSIRLRNFGQAAGGTDELTSQNFDLSSFTSSDVVTFSFKYAYRKRTSGDYESLKVSLSNDCGAYFAPRKSINGNSLGTATASSEWTPTSADWVQVHVVNVTNQYFVDNLQVRFTFASDGGNNFYLDDINFYEGGSQYSGIEEGTDLTSLSLYPNPSEGEVNINFNVPNQGKVVLEVRDVTGKLVNTQNINASAGNNMVMMGTSTMSSGIYFMNVRTGTSNQTIQFVVK